MVFVKNDLYIDKELESPKKKVNGISKCWITIKCVDCMWEAIGAAFSLHADHILAQLLPQTNFIRLGMF